MNVIAASLLRAIMPLSGQRADTFSPWLSIACDKYAINTPARLAMFLANIAEESSQLNAVVESCNYSDPARLLRLFPRDFKDLADATAVQKRGEQAIANRIYANQNGNGNEASGDGFTFRGRSLGMITGRNGYNAVGNGLSLDLLHRPELLEVPEHATNAAAYWWGVHKLNNLADAGRFQAVCGVWNVGNPNASANAIIGFYDRELFFKRACDALKLPKPT